MNYIIARIVAFIFILILVLYQPQPTLLMLMLVLGQAHFTITYLYQYKAKKIDKKYIINYLIYGVFLFGSYLLYPNFTVLAMITGSYFVLHFLYDERFMLGDHPHYLNWVETSPILFLYTGLILKTTEQFSVIYYFGLYAGMSLLAALLLMYFFKKIPFTRSSGYFLFFSLIILGISFFDVLNFNKNYLYFIILLHYLNWYVHYFIKQFHNKKFMQPYIINIIVFNLVSIGLYYFYTSSSGAINQGLSVFYSRDFFFLWTLLHYVGTFRKTDLYYWNMFSAIKNK